MGTKGWIIFASIAVIILGGLIYLSNQGKIDVSEFDYNAIIAGNEKSGNIGDHVLGNKDSKVVLIEYGDFQCPGCAGVQPRIKEVVEEYGDHVAFVFRNLPLTSIHPNARAAASAAEAAGLQGKYWEMYERIFTSQNEWGSASVSERGAFFRGYAATLQLDLEKFDADLASSEVGQKIAFDQAIFRATGHQQSTPTFTLNGELVPKEDWETTESLSAFIRKKLTEAGVDLSNVEENTPEEESEEE